MKTLVRQRREVDAAKKETGSGLCLVGGHRITVIPAPERESPGGHSRLESTPIHSDLAPTR